MDEFDRFLAGGLIVGLLIGGAMVVVAASYTVPVSSGVPFQTESDLIITTGEATDIESGTPFIDNATVDLRQIQFKGKDASATVSDFNYTDSVGRTWTNLSQVSINAGGNLTVIRPEATAHPTKLEGAVDTFRIAGDYNFSENGRTEAYVDAGADWNLTVKNTGLSQGRGVVAKDPDTGSILDAATVQPDGDVELNELSGYTGPLNIEKGPATLTVFQADKPSQVVDDVELQIRLFDQNSDTVFERTVNDGKIDLTGIPLDKAITVTVEETSSSQYVFRRSVIQDVGEQSEVYLLNSSDSTVANVEFTLDDRTGNYPRRDTRLFIARPITKDFDADGTDETRYQDVVGDVFGGTGTIATTLQADERYRLRVINAEGDTRVVGAYTAKFDDSTEIRLGEVSIDIEQGGGYAMDFRDFTADADNDGTKEQFVRVVFRDADRKTERIRYDVLNKSGAVLATYDKSGTYGDHVATYQVNSSAHNTTYRLNWSIVREQPDGTDETISGTKFTGQPPSFADQLPIDQWWLRIIGLVGIVAVGGLVVIVDPALGAVAATGMASLLTVIGVVEIPLPALGIAGAVSVLAIVGRAR